jgi:hypothetical protein
MRFAALDASYTERAYGRAGHLGPLDADASAADPG